MSDLDKMLARIIQTKLTRTQLQRLAVIKIGKTANENRALQWALALTERRMK